jgi:histidinol-phosphate aminotransferase
VKDSYNVDRLAQELACAALGDPGHMRANVARVVATRERTAAALRARGFEVLPSEANFLFARPPRIAAREVFERLRARGIYVRWFDGPRTAPYLRISIGADAQMDRLLEALDAVLPPPA